MLLLLLPLLPSLDLAENVAVAGAAEPGLPALRERESERTQRRERPPSLPPPLVGPPEPQGQQQRDDEDRQAEYRVEGRRDGGRQRREERARRRRERPRDGARAAAATAAARSEVLEEVPTSRCCRCRRRSPLLPRRRDRLEKVVGGDKREDARVEQHRRPEPAQQVERRAEVEEEALEEAPAGAEGGPLRGPGLFLFLFVSRSGRGLMSEAKGEQ